MVLTLEQIKIEKDCIREGKMKLHLGCGRRYIPEFILIDLADYPHIEGEGIEF